MVKQHFAIHRSYPRAMVKTPVRRVLAENLANLMQRSAELGTQEKVAKKAGVSQTSVSQILRPDNPTARSPKLDQVEKIAHAFGLSTWQLLLDHKTVGEGLADLLMRPPVDDHDRRLEGWHKPRATKGANQ